MSVWTADRILEQSEAWNSPWRPPGSTHHVVDGYEFYLEGSHATLMIHPGAPDDEFRNGAIAFAVACGAHSVQITIGAHRRAEFVAVGATAVGVTDVVAWDMTTSPPSGVPVPPKVDVVEVKTSDDVAIFERTNALAWGYPRPTAADIASATQSLEPGSFLARHLGIASGTGGFTLVGDVARFWGAAVVPGWRGRGIYRGLVAARLASAADRGATLALVHAQPTSSPILQRVGFAKFGKQLTFRIDLTSEPDGVDPEEQR